MNYDFSVSGVNTIYGQAFQATIGYLPRALFAVLVVLAGIVLGNLGRNLLVKTLRLVKFEKLVQGSKLSLFLKRAEITHKLEDILATTVKWLIVLTFFISATNIAGLTSVATVLTVLLGYIPRILSAAIVLALGVLLAGIIESLVKGALASIDLKTSRLMGKISSYTVVVISVLAAFSEMGIAKSFIDILFIGFVAMLALGLGLAIGLGAKDLVSTILLNWYKQVQKELKK